MCTGESEEKRSRTEAVGMEEFKGQSKGDPLGIVKEGQRRTRKERRYTIYGVSNVTELRQGEQWKEDTGFSHFSVGTWAERFPTGVEGPDCSRWKMDGKERRQAALLENLTMKGVGFALDLFVLRDWRK